MATVDASGGVLGSLNSGDGKLQGIASVTPLPPRREEQLGRDAPGLDTEAPASVDPEVLASGEVAAEEEKELGIKQIANLLDAGSSPVDICRRVPRAGRRYSLQKAKGHRVALQRAPRRRWRPPRPLCGQHGDEYGEFCPSSCRPCSKPKNASRRGPV